MGPSAPVLIIGGGLTGISTALHLGGGSGPKGYLLCERDRELGGLARSVERDGFHFDQTGHWLHLRDPMIIKMVEELMGDELVRVQRRARIYSGGVLTPYPFQANLHGLSPAVVYECLLGFVRSRLNREGDEPRNFEEYINYHFGEGIAAHFMVPYNHKLWGVHPREVTSAWCSRFVPIPTVEQVVAGAVGAGPEHLGYNISFLYPRWGGIGSFSAALAARVDPDAVRLGVELEWVDHRRRVARVGGEEVAYEAMVSTIPLPELVARLVDPPPELLAAADQLRATPVQHISVASRTPAPEDFHWIYVPEHRLPFYRVGVYSNAMPSMAPPGASALYVELASRDASRGKEEILAEVLPALVEVRALRSADDVIFADLHRIEHAYVVFDERYERSLARIFPFLERHRIFPRGRYGSWIYNSMEDSLIAGREVAATVEQLLTEEQPQ